MYIAFIGTFDCNGLICVCLANVYFMKEALKLHNCTNEQWGKVAGQIMNSFLLCVIHESHTMSHSPYSPVKYSAVSHVQGAAYC